MLKILFDHIHFYQDIHGLSLSERTQLVLVISSSMLKTSIYIIMHHSKLLPCFKYLAINSFQSDSIQVLFFMNWFCV